MPKRILLVAMGALHVAYGALTVCNADNCLRAVRNTASAARGTADCSSFLIQTVTASGSTITRTVTATSSPSLTGSVTQTNTASYGTLTSTELDTLTITPTVTISPTTSTQTSVATSVVFVRRDINAVPEYASLCSGAVRYSSACTCIGVTASSTVTVPGPISYTTVTSTSTLPTAVTILTKTASTTIPASSTTQANTATIYAPAVTSTVGLVASTTITSVSTSTTTVSRPSTFCLRTTYSGTDYVLGCYGDNSNCRIVPVGSADLAPAMFSFDSYGHLVTPDGLTAYLSAFEGFLSTLNIRLFSPASVNSYYTQLVPMYCSSAEGTLRCFAVSPNRNIYNGFSIDKMYQIAAMSTGPTVGPSNNADVVYTISTSCPAPAVLGI
ncbi:hypothetical protein BP6252_13773 [Coleophoma cylindrospora]|uniref:Uncharacterized protein n=1 Tax=Coleophoma cylindrospora TaxID=1849047 RepID=A0A3D8Q6S4_9HELO|nr:hypothetical protein BP6252_13773 [Coleophoma cylindrospora]